MSRYPVDIMAGTPPPLRTPAVDTAHWLRCYLTSYHVIKSTMGLIIEHND